MAKHSHSPSRNVISSSVPHKPALPISDIYEISDISEFENHQTISSVSDILSTGSKVDLLKGTTDRPDEGSNYTAPVNFPDRESLTINLVPSELVNQLEEYRSDTSHISAFFWTIIGAILGVIINWGTSTPLDISIPSVIIVVLLVIIDFVTFLFMNDFNKRAKSKNTEIKNFNKNKRIELYPNLK